uniref:CCHC-type domain-containing protein n=1 Tax=Sander lucioperca TaxID=283035 RepID=A0A8D0D9D7_SANLU
TLEMNRGRGRGRGRDNLPAVDKDACYKCGDKGHWAYDCPYARKNSSKGQHGDPHRYAD